MKITQKQLIEQIKTLKEIKPRREWAVLLKSQIIAEKKISFMPQPAKSVGIMDAISYMFSPRKLAYFFAVILFLVIGIFGFYKLMPQVKVSQQTAALTEQTGLKQNVADLNDLKNKINDLDNAAASGEKENVPLAINNIKQSATELAKNLNTNLLKDPQTAQELAVEVQRIKQLQAQTFADLPGTSDKSGLSDALSPVNNALAPMVKNEIDSLGNTTLTDAQKIILQDVKDLYNKGDYSGAWVEIYTELNTINTNQ